LVINDKSVHVITTADEDFLDTDRMGNTNEEKRQNDRITARWPELSRRLQGQTTLQIPISYQCCPSYQCLNLLKILVLSFITRT